MQTIEAKELNERLKNEDELLLIDVLPEASYAKQHIPGAVNVPVDDPEFVNRVSTMAEDKSRPIVVYCADSECPASPRAAERLSNEGYSNVIDFEGGIAEWKEADFPVESETEAAAP